MKHFVWLFATFLVLVHVANCRRLVGHGGGGGSSSILKDSGSHASSLLQKQRPSYWKSYPPLLLSRDMGRRVQRIFLACFMPCSPPRFDEFSEKLVGSWQYGDGVAGMGETSQASTSTLGLVEEVMRSCGGAVQGIREVVPIGYSTSSNDAASEERQKREGLYLNRANDGFVFLDNGSFSLGPVNLLPSNAEKTSTSGSLFLANFMLGKSRIAVWGQFDTILSSDSDIVVGALHRIYLRQNSFGSTHSNDDEMYFLDNVDEPLPTNFLDSIQLQNKIRCRMPSPSQPWMLNRVKWEKESARIPSTVLSSSLLNEKDDTTTKSGPFRCWWTATKRSNTSATTTTDISISVLCETTRLVRSVSRQYNSNQQLVDVTFLEGFAFVPE
jgi:hypothetical protein